MSNFSYRSCDSGNPELSCFIFIGKGVAGSLIPCFFLVWICWSFQQSVSHLFFRLVVSFFLVYH
jgi:hypothetical protein